MAGYSASNTLGGTQQAISSSYKTMLNLSASNGTLLRRASVSEITVGTDGTPADNVLTWDVSRTTAIGTGTSVTPTKLQSADGACVTVGTANHTSEPTVTSASSLWSAGINQRATVRWVSIPGQEIVIPATDANGICIRAKSPAYTGTATAAALFAE